MIEAQTSDMTSDRRGVNRSGQLPGGTRQTSRESTNLFVRVLSLGHRFCLHFSSNTKSQRATFEAQSNLLKWSQSLITTRGPVWSTIRSSPIHVYGSHYWDTAKPLCWHVTFVFPFLINSSCSVEGSRPNLLYSFSYCLSLRFFGRPLVFPNPTSFDCSIVVMEMFTCVVTVTTRSSVRHCLNVWQFSSIQSSHSLFIPQGAVPLN